MRDQMLFGETQSGRPIFTSVAGARLHGGTPCHGLFGAKLLPSDGQAAKPDAAADKPTDCLF
jgi:hypothetical protein